MSELMKVGWLVVNEECNNQCTFCYAATPGLVKKGVMSRSVSEDALHLFQDLGIGQVVIIGGEPLMFADLKDVVLTCNRLGLQPSVTTNGRLLSNSTFAKELYDLGLSTLNISVQGYDEESHALITGHKKAYRETRKGIENALLIGFDVAASLTISFATAERFCTGLRVLGEGGISKFTIGLEIPNVNTDQQQGDLSVLIEVMQDALRVAKQRNYEICFSTALPRCLIRDTELETMIGSSCIVHSGTGLAVGVNGEVLPCVHWTGKVIDSIYEAGRLKTADMFLNNWNHGLPANLRAMMQEYPDELCVNCGDNENCFAGCPLLRIGRKASQYIKG